MEQRDIRFQEEKLNEYEFWSEPFCLGENNHKLFIMNIKSVFSSSIHLTRENQRNGK